jgi:CheY-like chemotaxis protein
MPEIASSHEPVLRGAESRKPGPRPELQRPGTASSTTQKPRLVFPRPSARAKSSRRAVLIIEDEPSIRNVLYVLLAGLGYEGDVAHDTHQALSMLRSKNRFEAVLLDLRSAQMPPDQMLTAITELRPSLVGRVLVITGEFSDPHILETLERCAVPHVARSRVTSDLWGRMQILLGLAG